MANFHVIFIDVAAILDFLKKEATNLIQSSPNLAQMSEVFGTLSKDGFLIF